MNANPSQTLALGISARALFDLEEEEELLRTQGREAYRRYQLEQLDNPLPPGPGMAMIRSLLGREDAGRGIEVVVFSDSIADASLRLLSSARQRGLEVTRAAFSGGDPLAPYLRAFRVDLFLSSDLEEAATAMEAGTAAALVRAEARQAEAGPGPIRIALEGRAVALALESVDAESAEPGENGIVERLPGLLVPRWIRALSGLQRAAGEDRSALRTALVSAEDEASNGRILSALRDWEIDLDQAFFTGDAAQSEVLDAFGPHIVFDALRRVKREEPVRKAESDQAAEEKKRAPRPDGASSFSRLRLRS